MTPGHFVTVTISKSAVVDDHHSRSASPLNRALHQIGEHRAE
ncbi:hypothetical protein SAMN02982918_1736 [Saccharomonospora viridis]|jgi:hypothetical protein|nr:hypothetical protein SAMN02982918_1736 [Saccharomonospora viridis]